MAKWPAGTHGGTYGGGSAITAAAALATVKILQEDGLLENTVQRGQQLMEDLKQMQHRYPAIGDVRGIGLMVAVEFTDADGKPDASITSKIIRSCVDQGLLLLSCGSYKNVVRWIPPLVVTETQIETGLQIFENALRKVL